MGEQLFQLEIFKLNTFLGSMEISTPETFEVVISHTKSNILSGLENCNNNLAQTEFKIESNTNKGVKRSVSDIEIIDLDEEPDVIECSSEIFQNSHDQKCRDRFVNLESRSKRFENQSRCKIYTVDEKSPKETIEENDDVMIVDENPSEYKRMLRKRTRQSYNDNEKSDQIDIKKPNTGNKIEKLYLNKKVSKLHSTLETIFEEPKHQNDKVLYLSAKKLKRVVNFHEDIARSTKLKSRKRLIRAKKVASSKSFINRTKVSMETLMSKLTSLE